MSDTGQIQSTYGMGSVRGLNKYVVYDNATGRIVKYGKARDILEDGGASMAEQCEAGQSALAVSRHPDISAAYCPNGVVTVRPVTPVTLAISGRVVTLMGVPVGAPYRVAGEAMASGKAADSTMAFTFGTGGMFQVTVDCFPAQDFSQGFTLA